MSRVDRVPGARTAMIAFGLTVTLGAGGAAAHALWQQSATATMTVSAASVWPGPAVTALTCANNASQKIATLTLQLPQSAAVTYGALQSNGSIPKTYTWGTVNAGAPGSSISLDINSQIIKDSPAGALTFKVTAAYGDGTTASAQLVLTLSDSNNKIACP
ncbi:hypothetical protein ACFRAU_21770 [Arthrobacter sp. NPDC056691]|uniref:hypothetical protein n=1 Tax=Arthrobacter sp. NPDC056691 TaxID=3345913 RepID=UPI00366D3694